MSFQLNQNKSISKHLKQKVNDFLSNRDDTGPLETLITSFQENVRDRQNSITPHLLCLETIFTELIKAGEMQLIVVPMKMKGTFPENEKRNFLREQFSHVFNLVCECLTSDKSDSQQALNTAMKLLAHEGKHLSDGHQNDQSDKSFPIIHLNQILQKLLSAEKSNKHLITKLSEFAVYDDFVHYSWKLLLKNLTPTKLNHPNATFIENYLEFLNIIIRSPNSVENSHENGELSQVESNFLCKNIKTDEITMKRNVNKIWNFIVQWEHNDDTHRQLLVLLLEKIIAHLDKPILLTDFLMDSLDAGGPISLLALQGIFILIHKFNMSYPNIYEKLYAMFEPEIFHMKFKPRLFYLADIFLTSTYLSESLVAAFIKRLARLALLAPPQDIIIILYFISNLMIRHPGLKRLIYNQNCGGNEVVNDPFVMDECDPNKSNALQSSLWEIHMLKNHLLPSVATTAKTILSQPIPNMEWDLSNFLEVNENDIFDQEISMKTKEYALHFEKPFTFQHQQKEQIAIKSTTEKMPKYWKLF